MCVWRATPDADAGRRPMICAVAGDSLITSDENEANARLIAAAPRLLACLKEAVASWELADEDADELGDCDALADWKAAIAEAEGRPR
jgi:hypothetical protein